MTITLIEATDTDASSFGFVIDEDDMASNSATKIPTQRSVKAYADTKLAKASNLFDTRAEAIAATIDSAIDVIFVAGVPYERITAAYPGFDTNIIENGMFASDTTWTKLAGWTIAGGLLVVTAGADASATFKEVPLVALSPYMVQFTVSGYAAGGVRHFFTGGPTVFGTTRTANGTYAEIITTSTAPTVAGLQAVGPTTLNVDNFIARRLPAASFQGVGGTWWGPSVARIISPKDYGVVGDGVTDDTVAFQACLADAAGRQIDINGLRIRIPTGSLLIPKTGMHLVGEGRVSYEGTDTLFLGAQIDVTNHNHVATAGQTVFVQADAYKCAYIEVFANGAFLDQRSYQMTHDVANLTITLNAGAVLGTTIQVRVSRINPLVGIMDTFSKIVLGCGVEISTTRVNAGRAIAAGWRDDTYQPGRQYVNFVMEPGSIIYGEIGAGFANAIWLNASYGAQFLGFIYGRGANELSATASQMTSCNIGVLLTGEFTSSDFRFEAGQMGYWYKAIASYWDTIEGVMITNMTCLNVGYGVWWAGRSTDVGHMLTMTGCHVAALYGNVYIKQVVDVKITANLFFQGSAALNAFWRFVQLDGADVSVISDNTFQSFLIGAPQVIGVLCADSTRAVRIHNNHFVAADVTSNYVGVECASGTFGIATGPNTYQNGARALLAAVGSDRVGAITKGDIWLGTQPTLPKYNMLGSNWWVDDKWLVLQNAANQSIPNNALTNWAFTEVRDPESVYTSGTLTAPAWATRVRIKGNFRWAASATGTRYLRSLRASAFIDVERSSVPMPVNNSAQLDFDEEFAVTAGQTLAFQLHQTSGGSLNLEPSIVYVLFT